MDDTTKPSHHITQRFIDVYWQRFTKPRKKRAYWELPTTPWNMLLFSFFYLYSLLHLDVRKAAPGTSESRMKSETDHFFSLWGLETLPRTPYIAKQFHDIFYSMWGYTWALDIPRLPTINSVVWGLVWWSKEDSAKNYMTSHSWAFHVSDGVWNINVGNHL